MFKKFCISKNKYRPFLLCSALCAVLVDFSKWGLVRALIFEVSAFLYNIYKIKTTQLNFGDDFIAINRKRYQYSEIEKYWRDTVWGPWHTYIDFLQKKKALYIKTYNKILPYTFNLRDDFKLEQEKEIMDILKSLPIKNEDMPIGVSKGDFRHVKEAFLYLLLFLGLLFVIF